jgi:N-acetylmuramoyl-L-alanine amidase
MSFDIEVAARTVYGEARGEPDEGKLAVAWVIMNRFNAKKAWYNAPTIAGVCMKREQFSCWNSTDQNYSLLINLPDDDTLLTSCRYVIMKAANNIGYDPSNGATFYHADTENPYPSWASQYTQTTHIGHHIFYKD